MSEPVIRLGMKYGCLVEMPDGPYTQYAHVDALRSHVEELKQENEILNEAVKVPEGSVADVSARMVAKQATRIADLEQQMERALGALEQVVPDSNYRQFLLSSQGIGVQSRSQRDKNPSPGDDSDD